jgi:hypothetical protein
MIKTYICDMSSMPTATTSPELTVVRSKTKKGNEKATIYIMGVKKEDVIFNKEFCHNNGLMPGQTSAPYPTHIFVPTDEPTLNHVIGFLPLLFMALAILKPKR